MDDHDWQFAIGDLGDPLADIEDWMIPPYPEYLTGQMESLCETNLTHI